MKNKAPVIYFFLFASGLSLVTHGVTGSELLTLPKKSILITSGLILLISGYLVRRKYGDKGGPS